MRTIQSSVGTSTFDGVSRRGRRALLFPVILALAVLGVMGAGPWAVEAWGCSDGHDTWQTALDLGSSCGDTQAAIDCEVDEDYYKFSPPTSGMYTFQSLGPTPVQIFLKDSSQNTLASDGSGGPIQHVLTAGLTYYVAIFDDTFGSQGPYTLSISGCNASCGTDSGDNDLDHTTGLYDCGSRSAAIDCLGDFDFYNYVAPNSGSFTFETTGSTDTYLQLYDRYGSVIALDDDSGAGTNGKIVKNLVSGELYYLSVNEYGNNDTGDYTLVVSGCTASCGADPGNDDFASATPLSSCGSTPASIDCLADYDYYVLTAPSSGQYTFETSGFTDTHLYLYDSNTDLITDDDDSGSGTNAKISVAVVSGQSYYLLVTEHGFDATGDYTLTISGCSSGGCGSDPGNDTTGTATSLGSSCGTTSGRIDCTGDVDFYAFTAPNGGTFTFDVGALSTYNITLYSDTGSLLEGPSGSALSHTLSAGQLVYVRVMAGADGNLLDYSLAISGCSSGGCGNDPGNDTTGAATELGSSCATTSAAIDCAGDLDYYALTAPNTGSFTFETGGTTDTQMWLYDSSGDVKASDDDSGSGTNASITFTLSSGQRYYIAVGEYGGDATGDYTLTISGCSSGGCGSDPGNDTTGTATSLGSSCGTTSGRMDCTDDIDFYAFTAPNGGTFTFDVSALSAYDITLYSDTGSLLEGPSGSALSHTLSAGQLVYVRVMAGADGNLLDYSLAISGCSSGGCGNDPGNDDFSLATDLGSSCGTTSAAIDCDTDQDFYTFTATADTTYTFTVASAGGTRFDLYISEQQVAAGTTSTTLPMTPGEPVTIVVLRDGGTAPISYDLTISGCAAGGCGSDPGNDDLAHATDLGSSCTTQAANIDCAADIDVYKFTVPADGIYTYSAEGTKPTYSYLKDADGNTIQQTGHPITNAETAGSVRYFQVSPNSTLDAPFAYTLGIAGCASGSCGADPGNDDSDHATDLGTGIGNWPATIDCPGDVDVYSFTAPLSGSYVLMTTGSTDTWMQLSDQAVIASDDNSGQDTNASITANLTGGTKYFVAIEEASGTGTGAYVLGIAGSGGGTVYTYLVPATAKVTGLAGTDWRSDLSIVNTQASAALVTIEAWLRDQANPAPTAVTRVLPGGEAFNKTDLLASLFGFGSGASAAIKITSDNELAVSTRTYNLTGNGTYGQYIRGRDLAASFGPGETAYLQGFREDSQARSNLGLVNAAGVTNHITVTFYAADGSQLGAPVTYAVPAQGFVQKTQVLGTLVSQPVELAWAKLTAADGPFVGYLSLIDATSGDPTFRPTMAASTTTTEVIQPGIAKVQGSSNTNWVSDMVLLNTTESVQQVTVELRMRDDANTAPQSRSLSLAAHECRRLADVLSGLFGVNSGAAAFKVTAGPGVIVDTRTFNQVASGTYGQYVPSMHRLQGVFSTLPGYFPMVQQDGDFRTNLGLVNGDSGPVDVEISLVNQSGTVVGTPVTVHLDDRAVIQLNRIVEQFTNDASSGGYLKLEVNPSFPDHAVHAFVSVVDQKTGDPVYETPALVAP